MVSDEGIRLGICDYCYEEKTIRRVSDNKCLECIIGEIEHRLDELENER